MTKLTTKDKGHDILEALQWIMDGKKISLTEWTADFSGYEDYPTPKRWLEIEQGKDGIKWLALIEGSDRPGQLREEFSRIPYCLSQSDIFGNDWHIIGKFGYSIGEDDGNINH